MIDGESQVSDLRLEQDLEPVDAPQARELRASGLLHEALLAEPAGGGRVRCHICQRRCQIPEGRAGYCRTRVNLQGTLFTTIYGVVSSAAADPIEKKPVFHYKPGSLVFSVGSLGCNFRCLFCQNWQIAHADAVDAGGKRSGPNLLPQQLIQRARDYQCTGVAWTYNEPAIWLEYALEGARLAKEAGLYTVYVTNGFATPEGLDAIGPYLDVYRVDIKSLSPRFYRELIRVPNLGGILEVTRRAKDKWHMHVEVVTNIVPRWNDDPEGLAKVASWIVDNLGELTPWHVTRFFPHAKMTEVPPTSIETLLRARDIGEAQGLKFVYTGNAAVDGGEDTRCPTDGRLLISRSGYLTKLRGVDAQGKCAYDGSELNLTL